MLAYSTASQRIIDGLQAELPQGILLTGQPGIGLKTAAQTIAHSHTKEVITVVPDGKGTISIDTVRDLYTLGRSKGGLKVVIIDDADSMGHEAQNALLKLLEEPVSSIRFILTSHVPDRLLQTIRSRVADYMLPPVSVVQSTALIDSLKVHDQTKRAQLLFIANGLPASLTRYAAHEGQFLARSLTVRDAREFLQGTKEERLLVSARYKDRAQAINLVRDMLTLLRRGIEANPKPDSADVLDHLLDIESALTENASVRLSLTSLALAL